MNAETEEAVARVEERIKLLERPVNYGAFLGDSDGADDAEVAAHHNRREAALLRTVLTALERAERERDASAAKAADWQAMRDERDAMIGNYHNLYRDTEGDIAMANLRAQSAEAALAALTAEVVERVGPFADAALSLFKKPDDEAGPTFARIETPIANVAAARDLLAKLKGEG